MCLLALSVAYDVVFLSREKPGAIRSGAMATSTMGGHLLSVKS
jgi:hypothetical protein